FRLREFLQLAPSLALLGGLAVVCLANAASEPQHFGLNSRWPARALLVFGFATILLLAMSYEESIVMRVVNERGVRDFVRSPDEFVADELSQLPPGPLFVWGNGSELYLLTGRAPAASNLNVIPLSGNLPGSVARRARLMAELQVSQPVVVAVSPEAVRSGNGLALDAFPELDALLQASYAPDDK